jgi:hypothetical protein
VTSHVAWWCVERAANTLLFQPSHCASFQPLSLLSTMKDRRTPNTHSLVSYWHRPQAAVTHTKTVYFSTSATNPHNLSYQTRYIEKAPPPHKRARPTADDDYLDDIPSIVDNPDTTQAPLDPDYVDYVEDLGGDSMPRRRGSVRLILPATPDLV